MASVRFEADNLLEYAESQVVGVEYERALREPPWDGKTPLMASRYKIDLTLSAVERRVTLDK